MKIIVVCNIVYIVFSKKLARQNLDLFEEAIRTRNADGSWFLLLV